MGLFDVIFGSYSDKEIKKIQPLVDRILSLDEEYQGLTDNQLKEKTLESVSYTHLTLPTNREV